MNEREIFEAMETCHPKSGEMHDRDLPALADAIVKDTEILARSERIQAWDTTLTKALEDIAVPDGLADRLLDKLQTHEPESSNLAIAAQRLPASVDSTITPAQHQNSPSSWRRRLPLAAASIAALLLISLAIYQGQSLEPQASPEFAAAVIGWSQSLDGTDWNSDFSTPKVRNLLIDRSIQATPHRWSQVDTQYSPETLVLDLTPRHEQAVYLFAIPESSAQPKLPSAPPAVAFSNTGGFAVGMWHRGGVTYVLAVRGGGRRYSSLIRSSIILG